MEKMRAFITLSYGEDEDHKDEDLINNPFISAEFLMDRLDQIGDKKGIDLSVFQAVLRTMRFLPGLDAVRLPARHAALLYYVPLQYFLVLTTAATPDHFSA